jgi:hypothetical protein
MFTIVPKDAINWQYALASIECATIGIDIAFNCREQFHHNVIAAVPASPGWRLIQFDQCVVGSNTLPLAPFADKAALWYPEMRYVSFMYFKSVAIPFYKDL